MVSLTPITDAVRTLFARARTEPSPFHTEDERRIDALTLDVGEPLQLYVAAAQDEHRDIMKTIEECALAVSNAIYSLAGSHTDTPGNHAYFCATLLSQVGLFTHRRINEGERDAPMMTQPIENVPHGRA